MAQKKKVEETTTEPIVKRYVAERFDTLESIAVKLRVDLNDLIEWNNIKPNTRIAAGTSVIVGKE